jgi:hypothetical protein
MGSLSIWHWFIVLVYLVLSVVPAALILRKAGFSPWWSILTAIPLMNFFAVWVFALIQWPTEVRPQR